MTKGFAGWLVRRPRFRLCYNWFAVAAWLMDTALAFRMPLWAGLLWLCVCVAGFLIAAAGVIVANVDLRRAAE